MSLILQGATTDWVFSMRALLPVVLLALTGLVVFGINSLRPDGRDNKLLALTSIAGTLSALGVAIWYLIAGTGQPTHGGAISLFSGAIIVDGLGLFFTAIFTSVATLVIAASYDYFESDANPASFYSLLLLATTAMGLMAVSNSLATVFISLEMASLPSYALVAYLKDNRGSVEAGLKYFLIGAVSSAVLAFGISLVYAATGSLLLPDVAAQIGSIGDLNGVLGIGIVMVAGGVAFKTASVPFHFWAPEAYEGAPAPVSAFLSSASKAAGFAVGFRVFATGFQPALDIGIDWGLLFGLLAVVTMVLGNFAAATQTEVKRMLAYSSIGHAGYALIGLAAITAGASATNATVMGAAMAHLFVYGFMNTGAFLFIAMVERWGVGRTFEDYAGLAERAPMASFAMAVFMFSLAGLPLFGGFLSKYVLFLGAINAGFWWLAAVGAVTSALSLFYYSRVVKALWLEDATTDLDAIGDVPTGLYAAVIVAGVATVLLLPGFGPVIETAEAAAAALFA